MNTPGKLVLAMLMLGTLVTGIMLSGCFFQKNKSPETISRQDKDSVAAIDRQEARGDSTSAEAAMEKDSLSRDHLLKF